MLRRRATVPVLALICAMGVARCVGDSTTPTDGGQDGSTDVTVEGSVDTGVDAGSDATSAEHLYATSSTGALLVFDVPVLAGAQPIAVVTGNFKDPTDVEIMPGKAQLLVVDPAAQKLFIFNLPITSASTAAITIPVDFKAYDSIFDSLGNLWLVGDGANVERYAPPLTGGSAVAQTFALPATTGAYGVAVNAKDGLLIGAQGTAHVYLFPSPVDSGSTPTPAVDNTQVTLANGIALNLSDIFVTSLSGGIVDDFKIPITSDASPTALGASALQSPARLKFGTAGLVLVVADAVKGLVFLQAPTFNTAVLTLPGQFGDASYSFRSATFGP